jgi:hypothetical protein
LRQRWPIPEEIRAMLGEELANIVTNREESSRARSIAARVLIAADALNLEQEKRDAGGEVVNVNLSGEVKQKHEHDHRCKLADFLARYDAEMARSAGLPPGVRPGADQSVDEAGTNGQANGVPGH